MRSEELRTILSSLPLEGGGTASAVTEGVFGAPTYQASLFEGSEAARAAMNDTPVGCQNREWTEPQRDGGTASAVTEGVFGAPTSDRVVGTTIWISLRYGNMAERHIRAGETQMSGLHHLTAPAVVRFFTDGQCPSLRHRTDLSSLPLEGSEAARAAMNDTPVGCQNREWTEPQRDGGTASAVTEGVFGAPSSNRVLPPLPKGGCRRRRRGDIYSYYPVQRHVGRSLRTPTFDGIDLVGYNRPFGWSFYTVPRGTKIGGKHPENRCIFIKKLHKKQPFSLFYHFLGKTAPFYGFSTKSSTFPQRFCPTKEENGGSFPFSPQNQG